MAWSACAERVGVGALLGLWAVWLMLDREKGAERDWWRLVVCSSISMSLSLRYWLRCRFSLASFSNLPSCRFSGNLNFFSSFSSLYIPQMLNSSAS